MAAAMTAPDPGADRPLSRDAAERLADTMFALATPSRLQILAVLRSGPRTVSEIIAVVGMEQSAVSHQLRVLRADGVRRPETACERQAFVEHVDRDDGITSCQLRRE